MKLETLKVLEVERINDTSEGIGAGINQESLPFVFELVSRHLYSNPIGSVIREITSNCFDSHIEAGVNEPVIITKGYDLEEGTYIEFKDVGVGLSPERIQNIYMNYFSSTKRGSNEEIGGFGIGSKTPLAYVDLFYIITIFDGIEYEYILHRGESKPTLELLMQKDTTEHNGTRIKIYVEGGDVLRFEHELKAQLTYFDNVWVTGWKINNNYAIYEGKYFKFRSDIEQSQNLIHICVGKVRYPIDMTKINVDNDLRKIPIAVKFDIGELDITPSREALRYDDKGVKLIKERIKLATDEILEIFEEQNPQIEDLAEFDRVVRDSNPRITFDEKKAHALYIWASSGLHKDYKFAPLKDTGVKKIPRDLFFMWEKIGFISGNEYIAHKYPRTVYNADIISGDYLVFNNLEDRISKYTATYISQKFRKHIDIIVRKDIAYVYTSEILGLKGGNDLGKSKIIMNYMKVINGIVRQEDKFYKDYRPSDQWVADYKKSIVESSLAYMRKMNQQVFVRDMRYGSRGKELPIKVFQNRTGIIVYGFREDKAILESIYIILKDNIKINDRTKKGGKRQDNRREGTDSQSKAFMVLQIAQAVEKDILGSKKTIYCRKFFKTIFMRKIETKSYIYNSMIELGFDNMTFREAMMRGFSELRNKVKKSYGISAPSHYNSEYITKDYIPEMLAPLEEFKTKFIGSKVPALVDHMNSGVYDYREDTEARKDFLIYLKSKGFKLSNKHYLKTKEQLKYEQGVRDILSFIKAPIKNNLLILNQIEDDSQESDNNRDEDQDSSF